MKNTIYKFFTLILLAGFIGCSKRNYFPDEDDPGLSRFTSYGFNIATAYINDVAYINTYKKPLFGGTQNAVPTVRKILTSSPFDTLLISWTIGINENGEVQYNSPYQNISLLIPVSKSFTSKDFLAMNGKRFLADANAIALNDYSYPSGGGVHGTSNIYFVKLNYTDSSATTLRGYSLSGLFDGNIGDSILITKGRFDFTIAADQIKF
jgi:hypothetical protein